MLKTLTAIYLKLPLDVREFSQRQKFIILLSVDVFTIPIAVVLSIWLTGEAVSLHLMWLLCLVGVAASYLLGLHRIKLNAFEQKGIARTASYALLVGGVGYLVHSIVSGNLTGLRHFMVIVIVLTIVAVATRLMLRSLLLSFYRMHNESQSVLIYGAGQTGLQLASALGSDKSYEPVAFVDDNSALKQVLVAGLPVFSSAQIGEAISKYDVKRIVLAMPSLSQSKQARIARGLERFGCDVAALPSFASLVEAGDIVKNVETGKKLEYLERKDINGEPIDSSDVYQGRCVLITGAGGTIGSELARQILQYRPRKLILLDISEHALYLIDRELSDLCFGQDDCAIIPVLGTTTDLKLLDYVMSKEAVDTVLHAAAYQHVSLVEKNALSGVFNNVTGAATIAKAAHRANVKTFVHISTDQTVENGSIVAAANRFAELVVQDIAARSDTTKFGIVRFGKVLGSSGSVVPLFEEQISLGGPVTLTHSDVTRYFVTVTEAVRLVITVAEQFHQYDEQGQIYRLDMGEPVSIKALAERMIAAAGYTVRDRENPNGDIEIILTGLRVGGKTEKALSADKETDKPASHPKIKRIVDPHLSELETAAAIRDLGQAVDSFDEEGMLRLLLSRTGIATDFGQKVEDVEHRDLSEFKV